MFSDTGALSFQLDTYRWEDHLRRMQDMRQRTMDQETADVVVAQYNQLVQRYNSLAEAAVQAGRTADALQEKVLSKDNELAELKQQLEAAQSSSRHKLDTAWGSSRYYMARALDAEGELERLHSQRD